MSIKKKSSKPNKLAKNLAKTILQYVSGRRYNPMSVSELKTQLDIAPIHAELFDSILKEMVQEGSLALKNGKLALKIPENSLAIGIISVHHKGFGFVKAKEGPDIFIPKHLIRDAVDGDVVEVEISPVVSAKGPEGEIVAIVKRSRTHLAGIIIHKSKGHYTAFAPLLGKDKPLWIKTKGAALKEGDRVICKVLNWKTDTDLVEGELIRKLGHISDPSIDIDAAIEEFALPSDFTKEAIAEAKRFGKKVIIGKDRLDLTKEACITIDPDTARDFDDAISLKCDKNHHFHLGVHIADAAHYVRPGSHLDMEAQLRCNSTYFPGRCVPMLPEELSNELCSLKPKVTRLTISVLAEFDKTGELITYSIQRSAIRSKCRFTYKEAFDVLQKKKKSPHAPLLQRMVDLCNLLKKKRYERGSIDFSLSDDVIIVDEKGVPQKIERVEYDITHQMIEEFMLKANELVATELDRRGKGLIFRIHEEPSPESLQDFAAFARALGFSLPAKPNNRDIQALFAAAKDSPLLSRLVVSFIRSMRLAQYSPENIGHFGLALEYYCHFTSPIRRYTDLIIERLLMDELPQDADLKQIASVCSEKERLSFKAESSVVNLKKLRLAHSYFSDDPTRIYPAQVTKIKPFALFFEVPMFDLEASLHISQIGNDFFEYNPQQMSFRGARTGKTYEVGQMIYVTLTAIDFVMQQSEWSLGTEPDTIRKKKKKR